MGGLAGAGAPGGVGERGVGAGHSDPTPEPGAARAQARRGPLAARVSRARLVRFGWAGGALAPARLSAAGTSCSVPAAGPPLRHASPFATARTKARRTTGPLAPASRYPGP